MIKTDIINYALEIGLLMSEGKNHSIFEPSNYSGLTENIVADILKFSKNSSADKTLRVLRQSFYFIFYTAVENEFSLYISNRKLNYEYQFEDILDCSTITHSNKEMSDTLMGEIEKIKLLFNFLFPEICERDQISSDEINLCLDVGVSLGFEYYLDMKSLKTYI